MRQSLKNVAVGLTSTFTSLTPGTSSASTLRSSANCSTAAGPAWVSTYTTRSVALTLTLGQVSTNRALTLAAKTRSSTTFWDSGVVRKCSNPAVWQIMSTASPTVIL